MSYRNTNHKLSKLECIKIIKKSNKNSNEEIIKSNEILEMNLNKLFIEINNFRKIPSNKYNKDFK